MHALRAGRGAHCPSVFVCVAHLSLEMTALFIYYSKGAPCAAKYYSRRVYSRFALTRYMGSLVPVPLAEMSVAAGGDNPPAKWM